MRALVTGATGFVGSHIARQLVERGVDLRVLHRQTSRLDALAGLDYESTIGTLLDLDALTRACQDCDWVFHVAAVADYWRSGINKIFEANVEGTRRVLQAAQAAGVQRVVFTSSAAAVGLRADGAPADETVEFSLPPGRFPYGYSKYLAERVVAEYVADGLDVVIVNPVVVLGPGDLNMISGSFITSIKERGAFTPMTSGGVAVVDVRDVARGHIAAAERGITGERYLLGTANYQYRDWYALIAGVVGVERPFITIPNLALEPLALAVDVARLFGLSAPVDANQIRMGAYNIFFNYDRAWSQLGEPQITMRQSVEDTYRWYVDNGYI